MMMPEMKYKRILGFLGCLLFYFLGSFGYASPEDPTLYHQKVYAQAQQMTLDELQELEERILHVPIDKDISGSDEHYLIYDAPLLLIYGWFIHSPQRIEKVYQASYTQLLQMIKDINISPLDNEP